MRTLSGHAVSSFQMNRTTTVNQSSVSFARFVASIEQVVAASDVSIESFPRDGMAAVLAACTEAAGIREGVVVRASHGSPLSVLAGTSREVARHVSTASLDAVQRCAESSSGYARPFRSPAVPPDPLVREGAPLAFRREIFVPMRHQAAPVAVLVLFDRHEEPPSPAVMAVVQGVADVAAAVLEHARLLETARNLALQLQEALSSRVVLEQAKGMLAERAGSDPDAAFRALRDAARRERRAIGAVAADVVERRAGAVG